VIPASIPAPAPVCACAHVVGFVAAMLVVLAIMWLA
jgi:hypothetical protein